MKRFSIKCYLLIIITLCNSLFTSNYTKPLSYVNQSNSCKPYNSANYSCSLDTVFITLIGNDTQYNEACITYIDSGATAWSLIDGNITHLLKDSSNVNVNIPGTYSITYYLPTGTIYWSAPVTRTVIVQAKPPTIILYGPDTIRMPVFEAFSDPGFLAVDSCTGIKETHSIDSVDTAKIGRYSLHYYTTNNAGLTATATRLVYVVDTTAPVINLIGQLIYKIDRRWELYYEQGWKVFDNYDISIEVLRSGTYFTEYLKEYYVGLYFIDYNAIDMSGNKAISIRRYIIVDETISIKLNQNPNSPIKLYPNPTQDIIYLDLKNPELIGAEVKVINTEGKIVRDIGKIFCSSQSYAINLDHIPGGIYMVQIRTATRQETFKVSLIR